MQFLMQIRPRWVNRHVHSYFHSALLYYFFIEYLRPCVATETEVIAVRIYIQNNQICMQRSMLLNLIQSEMRNHACEQQGEFA